MKVKELSWTTPELDAPYDEDLLLDIRAVSVTILVRGRNAWHSTWVQHYLKNATLYTDVASAKNGAEVQRERGNVFYIRQAPAVLLTGGTTRAVLCDAHPDNPFGGYRGCGAQHHQSQFGDYLSGLYPGISVREALGTFQHDSGAWSGPQRSSHSMRTGRLVGDEEIHELPTTFVSLSSSAQGSKFRLGWEGSASRYDAGGAVALQDEWRSLVQDVEAKLGASDDPTKLARYRSEVLGGTAKSVWQQLKNDALRDALARHRVAVDAWTAANEYADELEDQIWDADVEKEMARDARLTPADTSHGVREQRERFERAAARVDELQSAASAARTASDAAREQLGRARAALVAIRRAT